MELVWQTNAWEDYIYWQQTDEKLLLRINELIKDCLRSPFKGLGKPEPLKEIIPADGAEEPTMSTGLFIKLRMKDCIFYNAGFIIYNFGFKIYY